MGRKTRAFGSLLICVLLVATFGVSVAGAAQTGEFQITNSLGDETYPAIFGNKIVWQDTRGSGEIYVHDLVTGMESAVTSETFSQTLPDIYQDLVVYEDARNGVEDVFLMDLATGFEEQLTPSGTRQDHAAIWGDTVVWRDQRNITYDIYAREIGGFETRLTANPFDQEDPDIWGDLVVYQDMRNGDWEIYAYDLSVGNESRITNQAADQTGPKVSDDLIAWSDQRLGSYDVYAFDLATQTEFLVAGGASKQVLQGVYGDRVVWVDRDLAVTFMYDMSTGTTTPLAVTGAIDQLNAAIFGDKIVISGTGIATASWDIFMVTVDEDAPTTSIDGVSAGWTSEPATVTLTADDTLEGSGVEGTYYTLNGGAEMDYTGSLVIATEGTTRLDYWSEDFAGNVEATQTAYIRIDTLAPVTMSDIDPNWQEGPVMVELTADDGDGSGVEWTLYSIDGGELQTYGAPFEVSGEGTHVITYASADALGHGESIRTEYVNIDNTAPVTTSDIDPAWQNGPVTVTLDAGDPYSGVAATYYSTDGSAPTVPYTGSFDITAEGTTTVKFYSVDGLAHTETVTTEYVQIDNTAPVTTSDINSAWQIGPVTVTLTSTDPYSGVAATYYSTDGSMPTVPYTGSFDITDEGTTTVKFYSADAIGQDELVTTQDVRIDNSTPVTTSDIDPDWQVGPVTVNLTATDAYSGVATTFYSTDGSFPTSVCAGPFVISADGITTVKFFSVDNLGHAEGVITEYVKIDNRAPVTTSDIDSDWQEGPVTVTLDATDDDSGPIDTFYSTDDTTPTVPYTTPFDITDEGTTTVNYYSVDMYGHVEMTKTQIVRIDNSDPVTTSDINSDWQNGPVTVTLFPTDPYSGIESTYYYIDGQAPLRPYTGPFDITVEGTTTVIYYSIDALGHIEVPIAENVCIDNSAPVTTSDIDSDWQEGPVQVTLSVDEPYSGLDTTYYSIDDSMPTMVYSGTFDITDEGTTTVKFYSVDNLGNTEGVTTEVVKIDNSDPMTTSDIDSAWQNGPVTVTITPTDAHSGVAATFYSIDGSGPTIAYQTPLIISEEGTTTVRYYSVDVYGHIESVTTEIVRIDDSAPVTTSDIDSDWQEGPVSVTLSVDEPYSGLDTTYYSIDDSMPTMVYTGTFDITAEGTTTVKFYSVDNLGNTESVTTEIVKIDNTAPVTTDDAPADWQTSPVVVTLSPTDPYSGVAVTYYSLDGSIPTVVYTTPIAISTEGTTTIKYYSVDGYGHSETVKTAIVRIDDTVPATESDIDSAWRNTPMTVSLSTNAEWIYYSTDGSDPVGLYTAPFEISAEGTTTVKYRAETRAHVFEAIQSEDVRIDYTPPVTTTDAESLFWDIAYIKVGATDALSGVAETYMSLDGAAAEMTTEISTSALGDHTVEFWSVDAAGNIESAGSHDFTVIPSSTDFQVLAGSNRIATAIQVSRASHPNGADFVVLATGANWPDALGGAALAGAYDAPILLVNGELTGAVAAEIRRLAPEKALILGGTSAVSEQIESEVRSIVGEGAVERFWGNNRYETASAIAYRVAEQMGAAYDGTAFVVTGVDFPDAVAASPMAVANGWPVFLAGPDGLSAHTVKAMDAIGVSEVLVIGGESAVSASVYSTLQTTYGASEVTRLSGSNRYATALAAARYGTTEGGLIWDGVAVATGEGFADALTGGVLQGLSGSTMVLSRPDALPSVVDKELMAKRDFIGSVTYLGGDAAVGPAVRSRIGQILR